MAQTSSKRKTVGKKGKTKRKRGKRKDGEQMAMREGERQRGETMLGDEAADGIVRTESFRDTVMRREAECKRADESTA